MKKVSIILPLLFAPLISSCACVYNNGIKEQSDYTIKAVKFNVDSLSLRVGNEKTQVIATIEAEGEFTDAITLTIKDSSLATLSASEVKSGEPFFVTPVANGETTLTATAKGDSSKSATIAVKIDAESPVVVVEGVTLDKEKENLLVGATFTLVETIQPANATNQLVKWSSSDESIAKVDDNGVVTGVSAGVATIKVETVDGGKSAECEVSVKKEIKVKEYYLVGTPNSWSVDGLYQLEINSKSSSPTERMIKFIGKAGDEFKVVYYNEDKSLQYFEMGCSQSGVTPSIADSVAINYGEDKNIHVIKDGQYTLYFDDGISDAGGVKYWVDVGHAA